MYKIGDKVNAWNNRTGIIIRINDDKKEYLIDFGDEGTKWIFERYMKLIS